MWRNLRETVNHPSFRNGGGARKFECPEAKYAWPQNLKYVYILMHKSRHRLVDSNIYLKTTKITFCKYCVASCAVLSARADLLILQENIFWLWCISSYIWKHLKNSIGYLRLCLFRLIVGFIFIIKGICTPLSETTSKL